MPLTLPGRRSLWLTLGAVALVASFAHDGSAQNRALFSDSRASTALRGQTAAPDPMVMRSRRASANLELLAEPNRPAIGFDVARFAARTIDLNLFDDVDLVAELDYVETVASLGYAWVGQVAGVEGSRVILAVADGVLSGSIELPAHLYSVRQRDGSYVIAEVNRQAIPGDAAPMPADAGRDAAESSAGAAVDSGDVFDLLLYYTTGVKSSAGGTAAVNSLITASIAQVNGVYAASGIATRVRLVAAIESRDFDSGSTGTDLAALRSSADVRAARDHYGADIVSMLVSRADYGGRGYVSVSRGSGASAAGFNVNLHYSYVGHIYSLAHELGHNQGCLHEPGNNGGDDTYGAYSYSLGYTDQALRFYDVMSYGLGCTKCTRLNQFSSPVNAYQGSPVGTATQDNVRTINNTRTLIANYRPTGGGVTLTAPTGMTASAAGSAVTLAWSAPAMGTAASYVIEAGSAPARADVANVNTGNARTSFSTTGVGSGTYYIRVRASDAITTSAPSNEAILVVGTGCSAPPAAPAGFSGMSISGGVVSFAWNASAGARTYVIEAGLTPGSSTLVPGADLGGPATTYSASGIGRNTYYVRLRARNSCGTGGASNEIRLIVP